MIYSILNTHLIIVVHLHRLQQGRNGITQDQKIRFLLKNSYQVRTQAFPNLLFLVVEFLRHARSIRISFSFGQMTHVTIFINNHSNCTMFRPLGLLQVHTSSDENCDMRYLSEAKTYPNLLFLI